LRDIDKEKEFFSSFSIFFSLLEFKLGSRNRILNVPINIEELKQREERIRGIKI